MRRQKVGAKEQAGKKKRREGEIKIVIQKIDVKCEAWGIASYLYVCPGCGGVVVSKWNRSTI